MDQGTLNESWGRAFIDHLIQSGVELFCHAPGFRSAPLALGIASHPSAKTLVHFDERGACFHALGYAKATGKPAAVLVTSGTAVGNLFPAVMEAAAAHLPLILLTCDRPAELRDTMANQTGDQIKIFGNTVRAFFEMPTPSETLPENFLAKTLSRAVQESLYPLPGPVQINCPFAEPFFSNKVPVTLSGKLTDYRLPKLFPDRDYSTELKGIERGIIVLGGNAHCPSAAELSRKLGWPIFADIASGYRQSPCTRSIPYYHHILKSRPELTADCIIHIGDACVSKILNNWIAKSPKLLHIASHEKRHDPHHKVTQRIICDPEIFCQETAERSQAQKSEWFANWKELSQSISPPTSGEPGLMQTLKELHKPGQALFFGNSMPIRDADMFFFPDNKCGPILANRGLSGIDGNIATCAGIAQTLPTLAVMGDQTFLHDLNSLAQLKKTPYPVRIIVINNGGGGIFSFVAIGERKEVLDPYFAAAHNRQFKEAASLFGLSYKAITSLEEVKHTEATIIELQSDREENLEKHQHFDQEISACLSSAFCTAF